MKKLVDGQLVAMSAEEISARQAEEAAAQADAPRQAAEAALAASAVEMAGLLESLIAALFGNGTLALSDLPQTAQDTLNNRAALRQQLGK